MSKIASNLYGSANLFERMLNLLVEIVQNRLKILSLELREEKIHFIQIFLMATIAMFLAVLTFVVATITIIYALAVEYRLAGLIVATVIFFLAALILMLSLRKKLSEHPIPFTHALSDLSKEKKNEYEE